MDLFLIVIIIFIAYHMLRGFLRGTIVSFIDLVTLGFATFIGTSLFQRVSFMMYTTDVYVDARNAIMGMLNYNSILTHDGTIEKLEAPKVILDFIREYSKSSSGTSNYEEILVNMFTHLIIISFSFLLVFAAAYFFAHILRVLIMPHLKVIEFGTTDKVIGVIIGFIKSMLFIFIFIAITPMFLVEFNYETFFGAISDSRVLDFLYSIDPVLKSLLEGIYFK